MKSCAVNTPMTKLSSARKAAKKPWGFLVMCQLARRQTQGRLLLTKANSSITSSSVLPAHAELQRAATFGGTSNIQQQILTQSNAGSARNTPTKQPQAGEAGAAVQHRPATPPGRKNTESVLETVRKSFRKG